MHRRTWKLKERTGDAWQRRKFGKIDIRTECLRKPYRTKRRIEDHRHEGWTMHKRTWKLKERTGDAWQRRKFGKIDRNGRGCARRPAEEEMSNDDAAADDEFFSGFILVMGVLAPLTSGVVSSAAVAFVYRASSFKMTPLYAILWGVGQTIVAACIGFTRILATL
uniref:Uncharacterized protein n=1 Tax=Timema bartmani TaxID=61472 RepID=A0A7R9I4N1_9NEOP|nr:unnamed protein product [Timema bartmani]